MKRSTIVLLIVLAVMIFTPIIAIKIISNLSPETKLKSLKEFHKVREELAMLCPTDGKEGKA